MTCLALLYAPSSTSVPAAWLLLGMGLAGRASWNAVAFGQQVSRASAFGAETTYAAAFRRLSRMIWLLVGLIVFGISSLVWLAWVA